eukprot:3159396-Amphidinium_carterae.1
MVYVNAEVCDLPEATLGKRSREAVFRNREVGHGQHRSHASVRERSGEAVPVSVEPCDLPKTALGKHSRKAVLSNSEVGHCQHRSQASVGERSHETVR